MKKSELKSLIKEVITELYNSEFSPSQICAQNNNGLETEAIGLGVAEGDVGNFEKQVIHRLLKLPKYKNDANAAKKAANQIAQLAKSGDKRVTEMWMAWEAKNHVSPSGVVTNMDPSDDDYEINYGKDGLAGKDRLAKEALDQSGAAIGNDPNDPLAKKLSDTRAKEQKSVEDIRKLDGQKATREKRDFSKVKDEERRKQKSQTDLAKATKEAEKIEQSLTKKINKI